MKIFKDGKTTVIDGEGGMIIHPNGGGISVSKGVKNMHIKGFCVLGNADGEKLLITGKFLGVGKFGLWVLRTFFKK